MPPPASCVVSQGAFGPRGIVHGSHRQRTTKRARERVPAPLTVELSIEPGLHVYGTPIPEGYIPLTATVAPLEGLVAGAAELPEPHPFRIEGLDEQFLSTKAGLPSRCR